jgi:hypothetical protein
MTPRSTAEKKIAGELVAKLLQHTVAAASANGVAMPKPGECSSAMFPPWELT